MDRKFEAIAKKIVNLALLIVSDFDIQIWNLLI